MISYVSLLNFMSVQAGNGGGAGNGVGPADVGGGWWWGWWGPWWWTWLVIVFLFFVIIFAAGDRGWSRSRRTTTSIGSAQTPADPGDSAVWAVGWIWLLFIFIILLIFFGGGHWWWGAGYY